MRSLRDAIGQLEPGKEAVSAAISRMILARRAHKRPTPLSRSLSFRWSIWPSTLTRDYHDDDDATSSDDAHIHPAVQKAIAPDHHQFYGPWKLMLVNDDLPKFVGYRGSREQVG